MTNDGPDRDDVWSSPSDDLWAAAAGSTPPAGGAAPPPAANLPPPPPGPTQALPTVPPGGQPPSGGPPTPSAPPPGGRRPAWLLPTVLALAAILIVGGILLALMSRTDESSDDSLPVSTPVPETTLPETTAADTTIADTTVAETTIPETTAVETTLPETTTVPPGPPLPGGLQLTQAASDGVRSIGGGSDVLVAGERVEIALAVGDGSYLVQNRRGRFGATGENSPADTEIRRIGTGTRVLVPAAPGQWHTLHDVEVVGGRTLALVSTAQGTMPDDTREDLFLLDLGSGERRDVGQVAGWESGISRLHLSADGLIVGEASELVITAPLFVDFELNPALDPALYGLEPFYEECEDCPSHFTVSARGDRLAWLESGTIVVADRSSGARLYSFDAGLGPNQAIGDLEVDGDTVVVTPVDATTFAVGAPIVIPANGPRVPLTRTGVATID